MIKICFKSVLENVHVFGTLDVVGKGVPKSWTGSCESPPHRARNEIVAHLVGADPRILAGEMEHRMIACLPNSPELGHFGP